MHRFDIHIPGLYLQFQKKNDVIENSQTNNPEMYKAIQKPSNPDR